MTSKTTNKLSPELRAARMMLDLKKDHPSRWSAVVLIAAKIGCAGQTLHEWVKRPRSILACAPGAERRRQPDEGALGEEPRTAPGQ